MRADWLELNVPPLALTIAAATFVVLASRLHAGTTAIDPVIAHNAGSLIALAGLAVAVGGVIDFRRASTTVEPRHPERRTRIVTDGVYRWTRNPKYIGFVLFLLGLAVTLQSASGLLVTALSAGLLQRFQIAPEECWLGANSVRITTPTGPESGAGSDLGGSRTKRCPPARLKLTIAKKHACHRGNHHRCCRSACG